MAGLTKDELKSALVTHGVELNFSSAKKDELLELYDEYVAPNDLKAGEFSSDDEDLPLKSLKKKTSKSSKAASEKSAKAAPKELTEENSFIVGDIKIKDLNDEELIQYLTKYGIDVGPIVDSTRSLYQKKLAIGNFKFTKISRKIRESLYTFKQAVAETLSFSQDFIQEISQRQFY